MIVHLAGLKVSYEAYERQRCSWCGAILIDRDLRTISVQVVPGEEPGPLPFWEVNAWIATENPDNQGGTAWVLEDHEPNKAPADSCLKLPVEATA